MKKLLSLILIFTIVFSAFIYVTPSASTDDCRVYFNENFEGYSSYKEAPMLFSVNTKDDIELITETEGKSLKVNELASAQFGYLLMEEDYYVIDVDIKVINLNTHRALFSIVKSDGNGLSLVKVDENGYLKSKNGVLLSGSKITFGEFFNVKVVVDNTKNKYKVYHNGVWSSDVSIGSDAYDVLYRIVFNTGAEESFCIDNFKLYTGNTVTDISGKPLYRKSVIPSEQAALDILADCAAVNTYRGTAYVNGEKITLNNIPYFENGDVFLPMEFVNKAFSVEINEQIEAQTKNGETYVSQKDLCEKLGLNYFSDEALYFSIMGNKDFTAFEEDTINEYEPANYVSRGQANHLMRTEGQLKAEEAANYLMYSRPAESEIYQLFLNKSANQHPRVMVTKDEFDTLLADIETNAIKAQWKKKFLEGISSKLTGDLPVYEKPSYGGVEGIHAHVYHIVDLAFAYKLTGEAKYADRVYEYLTALGDFPSWYPQHFLDTGVSLMAFGIAYDWLYDYWEPYQKEYIRTTAKTMGLMPAYNNRYMGTMLSWSHGKGNWTFVCEGGIAVAAMAFMDDYPELCSNLLSQGLRHLEYTLPYFDPDGFWMEGPAYWLYANKFLTYYFSTLDSGLGTDFGYYDVPGMAKTAFSAFAMDGAVKSFNIGDAAEDRVKTAPASYHAYKQKSDEIALMRLKTMDAYGEKADVFDFLFLDTSVIEHQADLPLDISFGKEETGIMRSGWFQTDDAFAGYHAGSNTAGHGHVDLGNFVYDYGGFRWASDLGNDEYSLTNYGSTEDAYPYRCRAEGHNLYVINPSEHSGQKYLASGKITASAGNDTSAYAVMDISEAYSYWTKEAKRGLMLVDERSSLVVRDEFELTESGSELYWFMHTPATLTLNDDNTVTMYQETTKTVNNSDGTTTETIINSAAMKFEFISNVDLQPMIMAAEPLETSPECEGNNPNEGYSKIALYGNNLSGKINITVKITPVNDNITASAITDTAIDSWELQEETVKADGKTDIYLTTASSSNLTHVYGNGYSTLKRVDGIFGETDKKWSLSRNGDAAEDKTNIQYAVKNIKDNVANNLSENLNADKLHISFKMGTETNDYNYMGLSIFFQYKDGYKGAGFSKKGSEKVTSVSAIYFEPNENGRYDLNAFGHKIAEGITTGKFHKIDLIIDVKTQLFDIYLNGIKRAENKYLGTYGRLVGDDGNAYTAKGVYQIRMGINTNNTSTAYFDDVLVTEYRGNMLPKIAEEENEVTAIAAHYNENGTLADLYTYPASKSDKIIVPVNAEKAEKYKTRVFAWDENMIPADVAVEQEAIE